MLPSRYSKGDKVSKPTAEGKSGRASPGRFQGFLTSQLESLLDRVLIEHKAEVSALEAEVEILHKRLGAGLDSPGAKPFADQPSDATGVSDTLSQRSLAPHPSIVRGKQPEDVAPSLPAGWQVEGTPSSSPPPRESSSGPSIKALIRKIPSHSDLDEAESACMFHVSSTASQESSKQDLKVHEHITPVMSEYPSTTGKESESGPSPKFKLLPAWEQRTGFNGYRRSGGRATMASTDQDSIISPDDDTFGRQGSAESTDRKMLHRTTMSFNSDALSDASSLNGYADSKWKWNNIVQQPSSKRNIFWKIGGLFLLLYDVAVVPLEIFNLPENWFLVTAMWITRFYWLMDMVVSFTTGYFRSQGSIEMRFGKVAKHYLKTWFGLDFICILCDWLVLFSGPSKHDGWRGVRLWRVVTLLRTIRLLRLAKAPEIEGYISEHIRSEKKRLVASIAKIIALLLVIAHIIACTWYGLGIHIRDEGGQSWVLQYDFGEQGIGERYAVSIHWSLAQFMGENIMELNHVGERSFAILTLLFAFVSSAIFVSSITTLMTKLQLISSAQSSQFSVLRRYLLQNAISTSLSVRVLRNAHHHFSKNSLHATEENVDLLKKISTSLQMEVRFEVYFPVIEKHPFFQRYFGVNPVGIRKVCHRALNTTHVFPGDIVFSQDETPEHPKMYFLLSGGLSYLMDGIQANRMVKGSWACEPVLWTAWIHLGTLQGTSEAVVLNLEAKAFQSIITPFPSPHAQSYGSLFIQQANSNPGRLTDLAGVDLAECLCGAFAELEDDDPKEALNAWGLRGSLKSNASGRRGSWSSALGRRGSGSSALGFRRSSRELKLSLGLPVTPWNEGSSAKEKQTILQKLGSGMFNSKHS